MCFRGVRCVHDGDGAAQDRLGGHRVPPQGHQGGGEAGEYREGIERGAGTTRGRGFMALGGKEEVVEECVQGREGKVEGGSGGRV